MVDGLFTTPVYPRRRGRFANSAFPNKKNLVQKSKFIYDKQIWKRMFAEILSFKEIGQRMLHEDDVLPRGTEPSFLSALHSKNDTTNLFGYKLGESTENNKAVLFFSGKETIQTFNGSIKPITLLFSKWYACELRSNCDLFLNFRVIWSVNQIVLSNSFLSDFVEITSCVYTKTIIRSNYRIQGHILRSLFLSISVNSGFRNIYLAALAAR